MSQQGGSLKSLPLMYLIVPDIADIWRDCLERISWRNRLRIATGSNQADFRGQRHNPQLAQVSKQSCLRTLWREPMKMVCKRQNTDHRKASSFPGMKATYYCTELRRLQVQEGLLWFLSTLTSMTLHQAPSQSSWQTAEKGFWIIFSENFPSKEKKSKWKFNSLRKQWRRGNLALSSSETTFAENNLLVSRRGLTASWKIGWESLIKLCKWRLKKG